ncbi:hypothetical protein P280DRAFT_529017 [Massarina eburnea CBS 473.64]|uniref:Uncharacterized protein n=1 Tax=Massarina eburnea CBS 473.64 TaxID=1395130 RepID=A0A6A6RRB9_9PLEO|nr:hypothetical protein P280DRAFT_529017 [Massarina eburnea CBS 473.64]
MPSKTIQIRNSESGAKGSLNHHCEECGSGRITSKCFKRLHVAYCTAQKDPLRPELGACGVRFNVRSPGGCMAHPYHSNFNLETYIRRKEMEGTFKTAYDDELAQQQQRHREDEHVAKEASEAHSRADRPYDKTSTAPREKKAKKGKQPHAPTLADFMKSRSKTKP